ncbi:thrC, partial [Symbiodinium sp. CCMP2456]
MEEDDDPLWRREAVVKPKSLNEDPFNVLAEEQAVEACKMGFEVATELMETDLVFSSCGSLVKGTPDGGFVDTDGLLRLVQVVRVPLLPDMDEDEVADVLFDTVLAKVVKSQTWMKETGTLPHEFIIFCWLPPVGAYQACLTETDALLWTEALISNVRAGGWPFSLVVKVPEQPCNIFPRNFGLRNFRREKADYFTELSFFLRPEDFEDADEDEVFAWDLFNDLVTTEPDVVPEEQLLMRMPFYGTPAFKLLTPLEDGSDVEKANVANLVAFAIMVVESRINRGQEDGKFQCGQGDGETMDQSKRIREGLGPFWSFSHASERGLDDSNEYTFDADSDFLLWGEREGIPRARLVIVDAPGSCRGEMSEGRSGSSRPLYLQALGEKGTNLQDLFADLSFKKEYGLGAVNSINWARIMFQITYYFYTYYKLFPNCDGEISFSVPTGNFGDILAGYYARRMGLPVKHLIVATNSNDILHRFFTSGKYDKYPVKQTMSPSMDIGISSNFERYLFDLFGKDAQKLSKAMLDFKSCGKLHVDGEELQRARKDFVSACATEQHQTDTIRQYETSFGYTLCPHTACGVSAVDQLRQSLNWASVPNHKMVVLATAHPGKFADSVNAATGTPVKLPPALSALQSAPTRFQVLGNSAKAVRNAIETTVNGQ